MTTTHQGHRHGEAQRAAVIQRCGVDLRKQSTINYTQMLRLAWRFTGAELFYNY